MLAQVSNKLTDLYEKYIEFVLGSVLVNSLQVYNNFRETLISLGDKYHFEHSWVYTLMQKPWQSNKNI